MSIAAGELAPDAGTIDDRVDAGIVHQHFLLVNEFTIAENLALAMWGRDRRRRSSATPASSCAASIAASPISPSARNRSWS